MSKKLESKTQRNLQAALSIAQLGIPVFPCGPDKKALVKWKKAPTIDRKTIEKWWEKFPTAIPAFPTGSRSGISVVDLDVKKGKNGVEEYARLGGSVHEAGALVKTPSGGYHLYFEHTDGVRNSQDAYGIGIDVRGEGGYVIAPGAVTEGGTYKCLERDVETAQLLALPFPEEMTRRKHDKSCCHEAADDVQLGKVKSALAFIPSDGSYGEWTETLMALHSYYKGSPEGLALAQQWSSDYPDYDPTEVEGKWKSFDCDKDSGITIATLFAQARQNGWHGDNQEDGNICDDPSVHPAIQELNERFALVRMGSSVSIAEFKTGGDIAFITPSAFREYFSNRRLGKRSLGSAWISHRSRRTYADVVFRPDGQVPSGTLNLWTGWALQPDPHAKFDLILKHILEVVADGNEAHFNYIISWLADIIQNPGYKPGVALVLKGLKGVGKDTLAEVLKIIIGRRHTAHVPATERLTARFNAAFATAILIHVEEAIWGGQRESKGVVQSLITCPEMPLERKNIDTVQVDSYCRLLFTTNESWAVPATADERRYAVFEVSPERRGDRQYFNALYRQIENGGCAGFLSYLLDWKQPAEIELRNPPQTRGLMEQKLSGLRGVDRWWYEVLSEGTDLFGSSDFEDACWVGASQSIRKDSLRAAYEDWMRQRRYQGEIAGPSEFGGRLHALCSSVSISRRADDGERVYHYVFPPLPECRAEFARAMGGREEEINWPEA